MCMVNYSPDFFRLKIVLARKTHICSECKFSIKSGDQYEKFTGVYDGTWYEAKTCVDCLPVTDWLRSNCNGYIIGEALEDIRQHEEDEAISILHNRESKVQEL